jgi:PAS domain S-box-containing protein
MSRLTSVVIPLRNPHLWAIAFITILLAVVYYADWFGIAGFIPFGEAFFSEEYLHEIHRTLLIIPMLYAALVFHSKGALVMSFACFCIVLPRAVFISPHPDALARALIFTILASLATMLLGMEQNRRKRLQKAYVKLGTAHSELENSAGQLKASEERYKDLFESASEAIIVSDPEGNIVEANRATVALVGYSVEELQRMNIKQLLAGEAIATADSIQQLWIRGKAEDKRHEERLLKKDGTEVIVELAARAITANDHPVAIQTIARDVTEERRLRDNLQFYILEITQAQEEERKRIARELHDETAQGLAALAFHIEGITRYSKQLPGEVVERLEQLLRETESLMEGVRRFSHELRPGLLDHLGLVPAVEWLTAETSVTGGIDASLKKAGKERRLSPQVELVLFRIAQEALSNARRHSEATRVEVQIEFTPEKVRLEVADNGKGFELPKMLGELAARKKLGILGMQERARIINGSLSVQSEAGKGTTVSIEVAA